MAFIPDFEVLHVGVNCADANQATGCATRFAELFSLPVNPEKESPDASFTGTVIEWVKKPGRGTHGHISVGTSDLPAARTYLEEKGFHFDEESIKRFPDGRILVIYAREEIGGFAIHLQQK